MRYVVRYGETSVVVTAHTMNEAVEIVRNEYEAKWGEGAFDQYDVEVEREYINEDDY